jgi:hypothetical protein
MNLSELACVHCGEMNARNADRCAHCTREVGFVNVNIYSDPYFRDGLQVRYADTKAGIIGKNASFGPEIDEMERQIREESHAIINLDLDLLRIVVAEKQDYLPYRAAVEQGKRPKADFVNDRGRCLVEAAFYGIDGGRIVYAALALDDAGLLNYGKISMLLKNKSIAQRTTVFERNTYALYKEFVKNGWDTMGYIPPGHSGTWDEKAELVTCKHAEDYTTSNPKPDLASVMLKVGTTRGDDEFVELHILNYLNRLAIEHVTIHEAPTPPFDSLQLDILKEELKKLNISLTEK